MDKTTYRCGKCSAKFTEKDVAGEHFNAHFFGQITNGPAASPDLEMSDAPAPTSATSTASLDLDILDNPTAASLTPTVIADLDATNTLTTASPTTTASPYPDTSNPPTTAPPATATSMVPVTPATAGSKPGRKRQGSKDKKPAKVPATRMPGFRYHCHSDGCEANYTYGCEIRRHWMREKGREKGHAGEYNLSRVPVFDSDGRQYGLVMRDGERVLIELSGFGG